MKWTAAQVIDLAAAMDQILDDMGETGQCVCLLAKAKACISFEPFRSWVDHTEAFTLEAAKEIVVECEKR